MWREALNYLCGYPKIFSHGPCMLCSSLPRLAVSVEIFTTLLVAPVCRLKQLAYVYFAVATMPYLSDASISYHILFHRAIFLFVIKASH